MIRHPLLERLTAVRRVSFEARSPVNAGWNGQGRGIVRTEVQDPATLVFTETGDWTPEGGSTLSFRNTYRWTLLENHRSVRLEHARYGLDRSVFLFDLAAGASNTWTPIHPHRCGLDVYQATLEILPAHIDLHWHIEGPRKKERILYRYA